MDLHYSQTGRYIKTFCTSLNPLWIYTTLKPLDFHYSIYLEFESPMDLHYSQTIRNTTYYHCMFESPMDLHYSQTEQLLVLSIRQFESPMDLHYSQTI